MENSYFKIWFDGNGLAPTTNNYCDFNLTLTYSVLDKKMQIGKSEIKDTQ